MTHRDPRSPTGLTAALAATLLAFVVGGCGDNLDHPASIVVYRASDLDPGLRPAIDDLVGDLERLSGSAVGEARLRDIGCEPGKLRVLFLDHQHDERGDSLDTELEAQSFAIDDERCGSGARFVIRGGDMLSAQWGVYAFLESLGIRYLHPEVTHYPDSLELPAESIAGVERPRFRHRTMGAHRTHPIELAAPLFSTNLDMAGYQRRWIDWNVKMRQTSVNGWDEILVGTYAYDRGFPRGAGFNLLNSQQGGRPILDPDDPRSEEEQMAEAITDRMAPRDGLPDPSWFSFQFNPSEFTEANDEDTVRRLTFITNHVTDNYPGVRVRTINHGTAGEPTENLGVRFFDLPQFAPPALDVQIHTLMFYDLDRPAAGVYGNDSFAHMLAWALREQEKRAIIHFPESSWWLTFDLPVPLYLAPVTLEARSHDIELLEPYIADSDDATTGVIGHNLFTTGQEWGYWMIDYCVAKMTWDASSHRACISDITAHLGGGDEIADVLAEVEQAQIEDLRDPEILRFLVGSDDETETAELAGIHFHPLPPRPRDVLDLADADAAALETDSLARLRAMAGQYHGWADRIDALMPLQTPSQEPWVREIRDGLRVFALRAAHAVSVYDTSLALRSAIDDGDVARIGEIATTVSAAEAITAAATEVVRQREADYRYPPELTIAGDEPGTPGAIENTTIYPYRYLSRTHRMFFWTRPDKQLGALFGDGLELVRVNRRIIVDTEALDVSLLTDDIAELLVDWGDGIIETALAPHSYAAQGFYSWVLDAVAGGAAIHHEDTAAVVSRRFDFAKGALDISSPEGAEIIAALIPGFVIGLGDDPDSGAPFMAIGQLDSADPVSTRGSIISRGRNGFSSGPADLALELADVGALTVFGATIVVTPGAPATLEISGELSTDEVVALLVSVGGFEEEGARKLIADILGYTVETLPARLSFVIAGDGSES